MSHSDLSDQALAAFINLEKKKHQDLVYPNYQSSELQAYLNGIDFAWQECRRRATAQVSEWMIANHWATGHGDDIPDLLKELTWQIKEQLEKKIREAFEAGFSKALYGTNGIDRDEAYRAFLQERN